MTRRAVLVPVALGRRQPFGIDGNVVHPQPGQAEGGAGGDVTGVLHPHRFALVGKKAGAKIERGLRAAGDDDLPGIDRQAAHAGEVAGQGLAQRRIAAVAGITELPPVHLAPGAFQAGPPGTEGKGAVIMHAKGKRQGLSLPRRQRPQHVRRTGGQLPWPKCRRIAEQHGGANRQPCDAGALAAGIEATFGRQLFVGKEHGIARDAQRCGQAAAGRQARARRQAAGQDGFAQAPVQQALAGHGIGQRRGEQPVEFHRGSMNKGIRGPTKGTTAAVA